MRADPTGWIVFAGATLFMVGMFDAVWGLGAILNDEAVTVGGRGVIVWDFTAWGWFHLLLGLAMIGTSVGLFMMRGWARWAGVALATLSAVGQVGVLPAFPLWALIVIAIDLLVIYQLTAHWERAY
jgi:hypothetical protein